MRNIEFLSATGKLNIVVNDASGNLKQEYNVTNLVVDAGLDYIASRMTSASAGVMSHMAIGDGDQAGGATNPAAGDTALEHELYRATLTSATTTNNSVQYVATFAAGNGTGAITEAGIFNDASAGTMLCRTEFAVINKAAGDSMTITWTVTVE
jgi:hypothetical protein